MTFVIWAAVTNLMMLFVDKVMDNILTLMLCFGLIYPVGSAVLFFKFAKRHGLLWYFYAAVMGLAVLEYVLVKTYRIIIPNMLIMTALCLVFGCGIGSCFCDKQTVRKEREQRRLKRTGDDKPYTSILDEGRKKK